MAKEAPSSQSDTRTFNVRKRESAARRWGPGDCGAATLRTGRGAAGAGVCCLLSAVPLPKASVAFSRLPTTLLGFFRSNPADLQSEGYEAFTLQGAGRCRWGARGVAGGRRGSVCPERRGPCPPWGPPQGPCTLNAVGLLAARVRGRRCEGCPPLPHHCVCVEKFTLPYPLLPKGEGVP